MRSFFFIYKSKNVGVYTDDQAFKAVEGKKNQ